MRKERYWWTWLVLLVSCAPSARALDVRLSDDVLVVIGGYLSSMVGIYRYSGSLGLPEPVTGLDQEHFRMEMITQLGQRLDFVVDYENFIRIGPPTDPDADYFRSRAPDRFMDLERIYLEGGETAGHHKLDRLYLAYFGESFQMAAGRQAISWGRGRVWSPTDLFTSFVPTEIEKEEKPGVDAVRFEVPFEGDSRLDAVFAPGQTKHWTAWGLRASTKVNQLSVGVMGGTFREDQVFGIDCGLARGSANLYAEASYTSPLTEPDFWRGTIGSEWLIGSKAMAVVEFYYNGFGSGDPADYFELSTRERFQLGEVANLGRYYFACVVDYLPNYFGNYSMRVLMNTEDLSLLVNPWMSWQMGDQLTTRVGAYLGTGRRPAANLESEYGTYPDFYYVQLNVHF